MKKRSWLHVCQILLLSIVLVACGNTNNAGDAGTVSGDSGTETGDSGKVTTI